MTKCLIDAARNGCREIETSCAFVGDHRKGDPVLGTEFACDPLVDFWRNTTLLLSKEQVVSPLKVSLPVWALGFGRKEPESSRGLLCKVVLPAGVLAAIDMVPVVESRASAGLLRHVEGDGMHHMQAAMCRHRGAPNVPSVLRNLRLPQDDVEQWIAHALSVGAGGAATKSRGWDAE